MRSTGVVLLLMGLWLKLLEGVSAQAEKINPPFGAPPNEIDVSHVFQTEGGNCAITAAIKMVALKDKPQLTSMLQYAGMNRNGFTQVKVTAKDPSCTNTVSTVVSFGQVWNTFKQPSIVRPPDSKQGGPDPDQGPWWPAALTYALSKVHGVKGTSCEAQYVNDALGYIYGRKIARVSRKKQTDTEWENELHPAFSRNDYITSVATKIKGKWPKDADLVKALGDYDLYANHVYGIDHYTVNPHTGERTVHLINPHAPEDDEDGNPITAPLQWDLSKVAKFVQNFAQTRKSTAQNQGSAGNPNPTVCEVEVLPEPSALISPSQSPSSSDSGSESSTSSPSSASPSSVSMSATSTGKTLSATATGKPGPAPAPPAPGVVIPPPCIGPTCPDADNENTGEGEGGEEGKQTTATPGPSNTAGGIAGGTSSSSSPSSESDTSASEAAASMTSSSVTETDTSSPTGVAPNGNSPPPSLPKLRRKHPLEHRLHLPRPIL